VGADGVGQHQRVIELLGEPLAVRRPFRHRERHRPRRRHSPDGGVHRAADGGACVTYDYVIVGGGSAGCALANRLSADPSTRVLVLEAGGADHLWDVVIHMPAALASPTGYKRYDWMYESEPEPHMPARRIYHATGKWLAGA